MHRSPASIKKSEEYAASIRRGDARANAAGSKKVSWAKLNPKPKSTYQWLSSIIDKYERPRPVTVPKPTAVINMQERERMEGVFYDRFQRLTKKAGVDSKVKLQPVFVKAFVDAATFPWKKELGGFVMNEAIWYIVSDASSQPAVELPGDEIFLKRPYTWKEGTIELGTAWKDHPALNDFKSELDGYYHFQAAFVALREKFRPKGDDKDEKQIQAARLDAKAKPSGIDDALWQELTQLWNSLVSANTLGVFVEMTLVKNTAGNVVMQPRDKTDAQVKLGGQGNLYGIAANLDRRGGILRKSLQLEVVTSLNQCVNRN
jgi:hypothetical protein